MSHNDVAVWLRSQSLELGESSVTMVNLLWFRKQPLYAQGFAGARADARAAYYEGYAGAFQAIAAERGVVAELVHAGRRTATFGGGSEEDWDDIVLVRYQRLADLIGMIEDPRYLTEAEPHRQAAVAKWRFLATRAG
ncbi:hypothetical protein ACLE20_11275 [Rhizobium sp. YIM 134829]|uniref:hypothetical protein n=1 Tax=Rhizobium sp. YIM 134829 TaxID=3390453 RepID=UPI00397D13D2